MMRILVVNGPNLNLLGDREPETYGSQTLADLEEAVAGWGANLGIEISTIQSNHEGEIVDALQESNHDGIVINPGALTHTSRALGDAIAALSMPVIEVHISNIKRREAWRAASLVSDSCARTIYGRGFVGYRDALRHLVNREAMPFEMVRYGPHAENVGDLRLGDGPLVVLVHGGFWRQEWERDSTESLALDLSVRGFTTWNLEYRRIGNGGGWPGSFHDVLMALDFTPQLELEPGPVLLVGHSSGGFLGMWSAARTRSEVALNVALATTADLNEHSTSALYGASEAQQLLDSGAPSHADPGEVPTLLVHGTEDEHVPHAYSESVATRRNLELLSPETGHFQLLDPRRAPWDEIAGRLSGEVRS